MDIGINPMEWQVMNPSDRPTICRVYIPSASQQGIDRLDAEDLSPTTQKLEERSVKVDSSNPNSPDLDEYFTPSYTPLEVELEQPSFFVDRVALYPRQVELLHVLDAARERGDGPSNSESEMIQEWTGYFGRAVKEIADAAEPLQLAFSAAQTLLPRYSNLSSAYYRIPSEVWQEIFLVHVYGQSHRVEVSRNLRPGRPWTISAVNTRWRRVAQGLPSLWSTFKASNFHLARDRPSALSRLQQILLLSGTDDLCFDFDFEHDDESHAMLLALSSKVSQWRAAYFFGASEASVRTLFEGVSIGLPQLETIGFQESIDGGNSNWTADKLTLPECPKLKAVHLGGLFDLQRVNFPEAQIIHLVHSSTVVRRHPVLGIIENTLTMMNNLPSLQALEFRVTHYQLLFLPTHIRLTHQRLQSITTGYPRLLDHLLLPSLCNLKVEESEQLLPQRFPLKSIIELVQESSCLLTSLTLTHLELDAVDFLRLLSLTHMLEAMTITGRPLDTRHLNPTTHASVWRRIHLVKGIAWGLAQHYSRVDGNYYPLGEYEKYYYSDYDSDDSVDFHLRQRRPSGDRIEDLEDLLSVLRASAGAAPQPGRVSDSLFILTPHLRSFTYNDGSANLDSHPFMLPLESLANAILRRIAMGNTAFRHLDISLACQHQPTYIWNSKLSEHLEALRRKGVYVECI